MRLISPSGVRVSVADSDGERLKARGWKERDVVPALSAPVPAEKPKPRARRRTAKNDEAAASN